MGVTTGLTTLLALTAGALSAQGQAAAPAFDVASIRASSLPTPERIRSGQVHIGMRIDQGRVDIGFLSLADLVAFGYRVKAYQLSGPSWMRESRWDIQAKLPEGATQEQVPEMMQGLLAERFQLGVRRETRDLPVYALVVGKDGPKLQPPAEGPGPAPPSGADSTGGFAAGALLGGGNVAVSRDSHGMTVTGGRMGTLHVTPGPNGDLLLEFRRVTMAALAELLTPMLDRPVVDRSGLKGEYQMTLDLPREVLLGMVQNMARNAGFMSPALGGRGDRGGLPTAATGAAPGPPPASDVQSHAIFQSVQQFGLKLEARKAPVETIVVDHLEKAPTEN